MTKNTNKGVKGNNAATAPTTTLNAVQAHVLAALAEEGHDEVDVLAKLIDGTLTKDEADDFIGSLMLQNKDAMDVYAAVVECFHSRVWEAREIAQHLSEMILEQLARDKASAVDSIIGRNQNLEDLLQVQKFLNRIS